MDNSAIVAIVAAGIALAGALIASVQAYYARGARDAAKASADAAKEQVQLDRQAVAIQREALDEARSSRKENLQVDVQVVLETEHAWVDVTVANHGMVEATIKKVVAALGGVPLLNATPLADSNRYQEPVVLNYPVTVLPKAEAKFRFIDHRRRQASGLDVVAVDALPAHEFEPGWRDPVEVFVETTTQAVPYSDEGWLAALRQYVVTTRSPRARAEPEQFVRPLSNDAREMLVKMHSWPGATLQIVAVQPHWTVQVQEKVFTVDNSQGERRRLEAAIDSLVAAQYVRPKGPAGGDFTAYELTPAGGVRAKAIAPFLG